MEDKKERVVTQELKLENRKASIKDSVLEVTAVVANLESKPTIKISGDLDKDGRFILISKETNQSFTVVGVGSCTLEKSEDGKSRAKKCFADVYLRTADNKLYSKQIQPTKSIW